MESQGAGKEDSRLLQTMNHNELNVQANEVSPVKRSNIPRPNNIPLVKDISLNSQGFISTNDDLHKKESGPVAVSWDISSIQYNKKERDHIQKIIGERETEIAELKNDILTLRTQVQKLEVQRQDLKDTYSSLYKQKSMKENELQGIKEDEEEMFKELKQDHELELKKLEVDYDQMNHEISKNYYSKVQMIIKTKIDQLEREKNVLSTKLRSLELDIDNKDLKYDEDLKKLENGFKVQFNGIQKLLEDSKNDYENEVKKLTEEIEEFDQQIISTKDVIKQKHKLKADRLQELVNIKEQNQHKLSDSKDILSKISELKNSIIAKTDKINQLELDINNKNQQVIINNQLFFQEEEIRRKYHNKLQELKGNIRVFCRVKPPLDSENGNEVIDIKVPDNDEEEQEIEITDPRSVTPPIPTSSFNSNSLSSSLKKKSNFKFDKVFQMDSTNSEIFDEISQLVQTAIYGYHVCIFAYGQTGSGKTFTMSNSDGMIPRAIDQIFEISSKLNQNNNWNHKIFGEFLEIYNENINDLLSDNNDAKKYEIRHDLVNEKTSITDLTKIELTSSKMMKDLLEKVYLNRSIAATKSNERSSRSHSVYIIRIEGENYKTGEKTSGVLNLIDLAGSERLTNSQAVGERLKETQSINKSLSCLGDVIYALNDGSSSCAGGNNGRHIPFRNSKLTYLLQFSLLGNSKTLMFVNVSPLVKNYNETINSLRFATKVHNTKIKK